MQESKEKLFQLCHDWKAFEEAIEVIYMIQNSLISKLEMINKLKGLCSTKLAQLIEEGLIENYQLTPLQNTLGLSLTQRTDIQSSLQASVNSGDLPIMNDPFGALSCNEHFLHLKLLKQQQQLNQQNVNVLEIQQELNQCSNEKWGDLFAQHTQEFFNIPLTEVQLSAAEKFQSHRNCQLQVIEEIENDMKLLDPFWKNRLFIYQETFLQIKVLVHLKPDNFNVWLEEHKMFEPELTQTIEQNRDRFENDPLTPNEQSRIWPLMIMNTMPSNGQQQPQQQQQQQQLHHRSTRTMSAAVAPELSAMNAAMMSSSHSQANGEAIQTATTKLKEFVDKPPLQVFQAQLGPTMKTLFNCFCSGLEPRLPGISAWCSQHAYLLMTVPLSQNSDPALLQQIIESIASQNFPQVNKSLMNWIATCQDGFLYEPWRHDIAFLFAKTTLDSMIVQYCQAHATQLMAMDQMLLATLSHQHPYGFVEVAALVGCDAADPNNVLMGTQYLMGMAQQQMAAQGQNLAPEQLQAMMQQSVQQQCAQIEQQLTQQNMGAAQLASVYDASYPPVTPSTSTTTIEQTTVNAVVAAAAAPTDSTTTPNVESTEEVDDSNMFNKWLNNANLLFALLSVNMTLEAVSTVIYKYYMRVKKPQVAQLFISHRIKVACLSCDDQLIFNLKSIASQVPTAQTPSMALKISQALQENTATSQQTSNNDEDDEVVEQIIRENMKDPVFVMLQELLHSLVIETHSQASAMCSEGAGMDSTGTLGLISNALNTPEGLYDFISFEMTPQIKTRSNQVLKNQGPEMLSQFQQKNEETIKQTENYVDMVSKDIIPVYLQQLDNAQNGNNNNKKDDDDDPFSSLIDGCFAPTGVVDPNKLQMFIQFNVFRRSARGDPTFVPKVIQACQSNPPMAMMGQLISQNTETFVSGKWLPEEGNLAYASNKETKIMTWHENEVMKLNSTSNDPLSPYAAELTFLLTKKKILENPTSETVMAAQQQLLQWGQQGMSQAIGLHVNTMIQLSGGQLSPLEAARLQSMDDREQATHDLRRKLNMKGSFFQNEITSIIDDMRTNSVVAGSGYNGLENLMYLYHFTFNVTKHSSLSSSFKRKIQQNIDENIEDEGLKSIQNRLSNRDSILMQQIKTYGLKMAMNNDQLLKNEINRLKQAISTSLLRNHFPSVEKGQYGTTIDKTTLKPITKNAVLPPLDINAIPLSVQVLCLDHLKHLQKVLQYCTLRDSRYTPDMVQASRKSSVFSANYVGGHLGTSTNFLLWKLEFIGTDTAEDCQQQIYIEENALGKLIFQNMDEFRMEPFTNYELGTLGQLLTKTIQSLSQAIGGIETSVFFSFFDDPIFLKEKVWAQQKVDELMKSIHMKSLSSEHQEQNINKLVMTRLKIDSSCLSFIKLVEQNMELFINEPLSIEQQGEGWKGYLNLEFQAKAKNEVHHQIDRPELAKYLVSKQQDQIISFLERHLNTNKDSLFAPYGMVKNQCYLIDAIHAGPTLENVHLLLTHGYPANRQILTGGDDISWPLLHFLFLAWGEQLKENPTASDLFDRFAEAVPVLVNHGCALNAVANGMTPLYLAALSSNERGVRVILNVFNQFGATNESCLNQFIPCEPAAVTILHGIVSQGVDIPMLKVIKELGADLELLQTVIAADYSIAQSNPALHIALDAGHLEMAKELIQLGCEVKNSIKLQPWLKSELIKKVGTMDYVSDNMEEENSLSTMKVDVLTSAAFTNPEIYELLINKGADVNYRDPTSGFSPIHQIMFGPERVSSTSSSDPEDDAITMVKILLKNGANINARTQMGNTALYLSAQKGLIKVSKFLIENKADPCIGNDNKETPFHMACFINNVELIDLFLEIGGINLLLAKDIRGNDALMYSASFGKIDLYHYLVSKGADVNTRNKDGRTLFLQSLVGGQKDFATMLLQLNPSILNDVDSDNANALHLLVKLLSPGSEDLTTILAMWLVKAGVNVLGRDKHLCYPLHYAAASGHVSMVSILVWKMLEKQVFSSSTDHDDGINVMSFASVCGIGLDPTQIETLKGGGKNLVVSPLFFAAHNRRTDVVKLFLNGVPRPHEMHPLMKVDVPQAGGICDVSGEDIPCPGQYMAAANGANFGMNVHIFEAAQLAANHIRSTDPTDFRWSQSNSIHLKYLEKVELTEMLCYAVDTANVEMVELIIEKGADVNMPDLNSKRPLQYANITSDENDDSSKKDQKSSIEDLYAKVDQQMAGQQFQVQNPLEAMGLSGASTSLSPEAKRNAAMETIRTILVENGAQVFIANDDAHRGRHVREHKNGHSLLHRSVWNKMKVQLLNEASQAMIISQDDDLGRMPSHHAAARGSIPWLRVLREYQPTSIVSGDNENWCCLHEAAYAAQEDIVKLLLIWRQGQIVVLRDELMRRGSTMVVSQYTAERTVYSLETETIYGETPLEIAYRGRNELLSETVIGMMKLRLTSWTFPGMLIGSFIGIAIGDMVNGNGGGGFGFGLLFGLLITLLFIVGLAIQSEFKESIANRKNKKGELLTIEEVKIKQELSFQRELKIKDYDKVIHLLIEAGAMQFIKRLIYVKIWRNVLYFLFCLYFGLTLPYCLLRDQLSGKLLSEAFIKIKPFGHGKNVSTLSSIFALMFYLFFIITPFQLISETQSYGKSMAATYVMFLFIWVLFILYRALKEDRLWKPSKKKFNSLRSNSTNLSALLVLFFEWQQLCAIGFIPNISWPVSLNIQNWYSIFSLNLQTLGKSFDFDNFLVTNSLSIPSNITNINLNVAKQYFNSASDLNDLSNSETFTLYLNLLYILIWFCITGYLAASCTVRSSPDLQKIYPFIRSDFYGQLPGVNIIMPLLASGFFLSILSSLLGVMTCAYAPSANDGDARLDGDDDEVKYLAILNENECFHGSHKKNVMMSLLGLFFYMPSAFLVGIAFLNDEKNNNLDVRFIIAYEVIVNFIKVAIGLLLLFSSQNATPLFIFMIIFLLVLCYATYTTKPCREIREINVTRVAFHSSAILCTIVAAIAYGIDDPSNDTPIVLFFIGNMIIFCVFIISYFKIPNFFELNQIQLKNSGQNKDNDGNRMNELGASIGEIAMVGGGGSLTKTISGKMSGNVFEEGIAAAKEEAMHQATSFLESDILDGISSMLGGM